MQTENLKKDNYWGPPYYLSYDDRHNRPYVAGPFTHEELLKRLPAAIDQEFIDELFEYGEAEFEGENYELWSEEKLRGKAADWAGLADKVKAGEKLP